jgi:hypothetical protein
LSDEPGARLYKTGDVARYLPTGEIEFVGRRDDQVKVRGFRVELGEVEAVLGEHMGVREAVVVARDAVGGEKRLVAYVVGHEGQTVSTGDLRRYLKERVPEYMVPSAFMILDALPLTPNGKVNRRALPLPDRARPELEDAFIAPHSPVEDVLAGIWAQVLDLEQVGIHDNFFELGGHSLTATQVMSRLREAFRICGRTRQERRGSAPGRTVLAVSAYLSNRARRQLASLLCAAALMVSGSVSARQHFLQHFRRGSPQGAA